MPSLRQKKVNNLMQKLSADFLKNESTDRSLITVTDFRISSDLKKGTIFITVLPSSEEEAALDFARRKRSDIREYIKSKTEMRSLPYIDVKIDEGEKNRQKIERLLAE